MCWTFRSFPINTSEEMTVMKNKNKKKKKSSIFDNDAFRIAFKIFIVVAIIAALVIVWILLMPVMGIAAPRKTIAVIGEGSLGRITDNSNETYVIEELEIHSEDGYFDVGNYIFDTKGTPFSVKNSSGDEVCTVKLTEKSKIYKADTLTLNLAVYKFDYIDISEKYGAVYIIGDPNVASQALHISVLERSTPLDIYFKNVNIYTEQFIPVLINYSTQNINIIVEGDNKLSAGNKAPSSEILEETKKALDSNSTNSTNAFTRYATMSHVVWNNPDNNIIVEGWQAVFDLGFVTQQIMVDIVHGFQGADGTDGASTIVSLGNVAIYGDGSLEVVAGDGCNGSNGSEHGFHAEGGDGGNSGHAIAAPLLISSLNESELILTPGKPGLKGYGHNIYGQSNGKDGHVSSVLNVLTTYMNH